MAAKAGELLQKLLKLLCASTVPLHSTLLKSLVSLLAMSCSISFEINVQKPTSAFCPKTAAPFCPQTSQKGQVELRHSQTCAFSFLRSYGVMNSMARCRLWIGSRS